MSSSSTSSASFAPLQFTGISQYSSDFQQILSRAVSIAQIPVMQLTNEQTQIDTEETDLGNLNTAVAAVGSALQTLGNLGSGGALSATTSDSNVVTATATGATAPASYTISNVSSIATAASETSTTGYPDGTTTAVSATGTMKLVYGSNSYTITLGTGQNNLNGLRDAINNLGAGVTASVLTTGGTNGDYLSVSANSPGATTLQLIDNPSGTANNVLTSSNQGKNTNFNLNGIPISTPGTTVNSVIPGVTLNFTGTTSANENVNVNVATNPSQISSALQTLVSSYNTLQTQMNSQFGTTAGSLQGNNILTQIQAAMSSIVQYQGSGSMPNLTSLGIEMSQTGQMSLNQTTFNSLSDSQISSALSLLGSSTTGVGGIQSAFNQITDPITGSITAQTTDWNTMSQNLASQIATKNASIQQTQTSVNQRLQAADAMIAQLTSQQSILTASITSLSYVDYGYNSNSSTTNSM
ncbi:MAG: flagellar filament capping protein FliD [Acidobacteriaceae bacterium]|nr:flagellar filament capping protein FliD [Acidobacteriaceae bacterium]